MALVHPSSFRKGTLMIQLAVLSFLNIICPYANQGCRSSHHNTPCMTTCIYAIASPEKVNDMLVEAAEVKGCPERIKYA